MKKILFLLLIALLSTNFTACSDDDKEEPILVSGQNFDIDKTFNVTNQDNTATVIVNIEASKGIQNLLVSIQSPALTEATLDVIGLKGEFDLANPGKLEQSLTQLGLIDPSSPIKNAKSTKFDVSEFMPLLGGFGLKGPHKFNITIKDTENNSLTKILTINFPNLKN